MFIYNLKLNGLITLYALDIAAKLFKVDESKLIGTEFVKQFIPNKSY